MFAWCHFPDLNAIALRRDIEKRKPQVKLINEQCWQRLADLAITLGFESKKAIRLRIQDSDTKMTLEFLRQVRPLESLISRMKFIWILQTKSVVFYVTSRKSKEYKWDEWFDQGLGYSSRAAMWTTSWRITWKLKKINFCRWDLWVTEARAISFCYQPWYLPCTLRSTIPFGFPARMRLEWTSATSQAMLLFEDLFKGTEAAGPINPTHNERKTVSKGKQMGTPTYQQISRYAVAYMPLGLRPKRDGQRGVSNLICSCKCKSASKNISIPKILDFWWAAHTKSSICMMLVCFKDEP